MSKPDRLPAPRSPFAVVVVAVLAATAGNALAARPGTQAPAKPGTTTAPDKPEGQAVPYAELEHHVGQEVVIHTTLGTVRRGVLAKYTNVALTLKMVFGTGTIDLTVPKETVRTARLIPGGAAPPADGKAREASSAEKN